MVLNDYVIGFLNHLISEGAINPCNIDRAWLEAKGCVLDDEHGVVMTIEDWIDETEDLEDGLVQE